MISMYCTMSCGSVTINNYVKCVKWLYVCSQIKALPHHPTAGLKEKIMKPQYCYIKSMYDDCKRR